MSTLFRRTNMIAAWALMTAVVCAQGSSCVAPLSLAPLHPPSAGPTISPLQAYVDPEQGDDGLALAHPGAFPFKTIQAAVSAVSSQRAVSQFGDVVLMPGWYGYDPSAPRYNGEAWPVVVPAGVHIRGVNALNVTIDGGKKIPGATTYSVPSVTQSGFVDVVPCFVYGAGQVNGFDFNLLNRVTIVDADVGVLVTGSGEVNPTIAECLFMNCTVGAQVHSSGSGIEGAHRPRFLWCTFGNSDVGFALTGAIGGAVSATRARPALVNLLFKNTVDFEGVPCHAIAACAFASMRVNQSTFVPQPLATEAPTPVFDVECWEHSDLFIGARSSVMQATYSATAQSEWWFTDWRLTFRTAYPTAIPNPAEGPGVTLFPAITPNGTTVGTTFGAGPVLGIDSSEGPGTYGPLNGPYGGATGHIGYRSGGTFIVGGTVPGERRFGADANGIMFDHIEVHWRPGQPSIAAGVVHPSVPRLWRQNQEHAEGIVPSGVLAASVLGPSFVGDIFVDVWTYPMDLVVTNLLTSTLASSAGSGYAMIDLSSFGAAPTFPKFGGVWQAAFLDATTQVVTGDAQAFYVGQ